MNRWPHSDYFRDRRSERDLCSDFPGDEILIDGLHAMQLHFINNNVNIDIPVLRVMNTVHYIAAYMFATSCSGDPIEYEIMAYDSLSRDKQLTIVTMIVLAAMLKRTEGFRAQNCRNLILENRSQDFEEGVSLYDRFLRKAEERFAEEDFLLDVPAQMQRLQEENEQLISENVQLKYTLTKMENQQNTQYNHCVIYNAPVYNTTNTTNNYYPQQQTEKTEPDENLACSFSDQARTIKNSPNNAAKYEHILPIPQKGKYSQVRKYIQERCKFDEEFKTFVEGHTRLELCLRLTDEFGWDVDEHSLGVNMNRNR